jgi:hypothetical protein
MSSVFDQQGDYQQGCFDQQSGRDQGVIATVINAPSVINAEREG